jgi:hypothetical protein
MAKTTSPRVWRRYVGGPKDGVKGKVDARIGLIGIDGVKDREYVLTRLHPSTGEVTFDPEAGYRDPKQADAEFFFAWRERGWTDPKMPPIRGAWNIVEKAPAEG